MYSKSLKIKKFKYYFILLLVFTSCSIDEEDEIYYEKVEQPKIEYSKIELEILTDVNIHRTSIGLNTLERMNIISTVAKSHSDYMATTGIVSHENFLRREEKLISYTSAKSVGENVGFGYNNAEDAVQAWLKSDGHRRVIENPNYTHFGISTSKNDKGLNYFTHIFIKQ